MRELKKKLSIRNVSNLLSDNELKRVLGGGYVPGGPCGFHCYTGEYLLFVTSNTCLDAEAYCADLGFTYVGNCTLDPIIQDWGNYANYDMWGNLLGGALYDWCFS